VLKLTAGPTSLLLEADITALRKERDLRGSTDRDKSIEERFMGDVHIWRAKLID
jgi:hypothetical protein